MRIFHAARAYGKSAALRARGAVSTCVPGRMPGARERILWQTGRIAQPDPVLPVRRAAHTHMRPPAPATGRRGGSREVRQDGRHVPGRDRLSGWQRERADKDPGDPKDGFSGSAVQIAHAIGAYEKPAALPACGAVSISCARCDGRARAVQIRADTRFRPRARRDIRRDNGTARETQRPNRISALRDQEICHQISRTGRRDIWWS